MLNSKQRAYLKSLAQSIQPIFQVGKNDIGENMIKQVSDALEARELVKLHVLENSMLTAREAADRISSLTDSEVVAVIGSKFILYRETHDEKRSQKRIMLP